MGLKRIAAIGSIVVLALALGLVLAVGQQWGLTRKGPGSRLSKALVRYVAVAAAPTRSMLAGSAAFPKEVLDERYLFGRPQIRLVVVGEVTRVLPDQQTTPSDAVPDVSDIVWTYNDVTIRVDEVLRGDVSPGDVVRILVLHIGQVAPSFSDGERVLLPLVKKSVEWIDPGNPAYEVLDGKLGKFVLTADGRAKRSSDMFPDGVLSDGANLSLGELRQIIDQTAVR